MRIIKSVLYIILLKISNRLGLIAETSKVK